MFKSIKSVIIIGSVTLAIAACGGSNNTVKKIEVPVKPPVEIVTFDYQALIDGSISDIVPGIVLLVESPESKFLGSSGLADITSQQPMQVDHIIPNGSAGKKATALLTVMLANEGLLSLDDHISNWLPSSLLSQIQHSEEMTIRQLLNHNAGVYDYLDEATLGDFYAAIQADVTSLKTDVFALQFALNYPAYSEPGAGFKYSNTGYILVGLVLDEILGEHHSVAMRNRIFDPLAMHSAYYGGVEKENGDIISGYFHDVSGEFTGEVGGVINTKSWYENIGVADAPMVANVEDMALLLRSIVSEDSSISAEVRATLLAEDNFVQLGEQVSYGSGLIKEIIAGELVYHHGGLEIGYSTENYYIPATKTSITAFANCGGSKPCEEQVDALIDQVKLAVLK
jgi:D-alanyl-D-alanine carboxypeptidase